MLGMHEAEKVLFEAVDDPSAGSARHDDGGRTVTLNESFNGKFRDECLDMEWFPNRREAVVVIEQFRRRYNQVRPHSSLGYRTPFEYKKQLKDTPPVAVLT